MKICKNIQKPKPQCNMVSIFLLAKFIPSTVELDTPLSGRPSNSKHCPSTGFAGRWQADQAHLDSNMHNRDIILFTDMKIILRNALSPSTAIERAITAIVPDELQVMMEWVDKL